MQQQQPTKRCKEQELNKSEFNDKLQNKLDLKKVRARAILRHKAPEVTC